MRKTWMAAALAAIGVLGSVPAEEGKAPPPQPPVRPARCMDCNKARMSSMRGEAGYCAPCGMLYARIRKDGVDKAKEALAKAGATDLQVRGPFLQAKVGKEQLDAAKKAVEPFIQKPEPPPEEPEP